MPIIKAKIEESVLSSLQERLIGPFSRKALFKAEFIEHTYESVGNYVFRLSKHEIEQVVRSLDLPGYAWLGYHDAVEEGTLSAHSIPGNEVFERVVRDIERWSQDSLVSEFYNPPKMAVVIIFKEKPSEDLVASLRSANYIVCLDTRNPVMARMRKTGSGGE